MKITDFQQRIEEHWRQPKPTLTVLLSPLSLLYKLITYSRSWLYKYHVFSTKKHHVPLIVIGNLHVGGTGKTPSVIYIAQHLTEKGLQVGIVSRGYGRNTQGTLVVEITGLATDYGDEPLLIAKKTKCPTVVSKNRNQAIAYLKLYYPELDLIISDDGLQHYQMQRDIEFVVFPYQDINKSLKLLPNGPLREPLKRLKTVPFILISGTPKNHVSKTQVKQAIPCDKSNIFFSYPQFDDFYHLHKPEYKVTSDYFQRKKIMAACAIANPDRFFAELEKQGLIVNAKMTFKDHEILPIEQLAKQYECVIITEKDAVKLNTTSFNNIFVLPFTIFLEEDLAQAVIDYLKEHYHRTS